MTYKLAHNRNGFAVMRDVEKNNNRPFHIEILNDNPGRKISPAQLQHNTDQFKARLNVVQETPLANVWPPPKPANTPPANQPKSPAQGLDHNAVSVLMTLATQPLLGNTARTAASGLSDGAFSRASKNLASRGLIRAINWGRHHAFLVLTAEGECFLANEHNVQVQRWPGKGSPEHKLAQQLLKLVYEQRGCQAQIEACVGPGRKLVDVLVETAAGERFAVEYCTGNSNEKANLARDLVLGGMNRVTFVFPKQEVLDKWRRRFEADPALQHYLPQTELITLPNLLKELPK